VAVGLVNADSFAGLRALLVPAERRRAPGTGRRPGRVAPFGVDSAGRWALFRVGTRSERHDGEWSGAAGAGGENDRGWDRQDGRGHDREDGAAELQARALLRRYGVVFRALLERETNLAPWRALLRVYRRLEARGEIRGGRFVGGFSGEQYALPEAVGLLRTTRREGGTGSLIAVSAADPLNLVGIVTPGPKIAALATNRVLFRDGVPVAAHESGRVHLLTEVEASDERAVSAALTRRPMSPQLRAYLGRR
jgi:ATP-dependent Lhr-like helicase